MVTYITRFLLTKLGPFLKAKEEMQEERSIQNDETLWYLFPSGREKNLYKYEKHESLSAVM